MAAQAATTIGTEPSQFHICAWGADGPDAPAVPTVGQSIVVPSGDSVLDSFGFHFTQYRDSLTGLPSGNPATITYRAYVYAWDGQKATGPAVWASGPQTFTTNPTPELVTVETGGVPLTPGGSYVIFVSIEEEQTGNAEGAQACWMIADGGYTGGIGAFLLDDEDWTTTPWHEVPDLGFKATFSAPAGTGVYDFDGFYAPVNNKDASGNYIFNSARAGSAIPIKFSLNGDQGLDILADGYPSSQVIACNLQAEVDGIEQTSAPGAAGLSYDSRTDTYTYVWKTSKTWADSCRQLVVKLDDGTTARASFTFAP